MAKANFKFEKRQKELARMKKAEEKRLRKLGLLEESTEEAVEEVAPVSDADQVDSWLNS
ncbi:MAG: hypothetical protein R8M14_06030 [Ghiorsea sp.]